VLSADQARELALSLARGDLTKADAELVLDLLHAAWSERYVSR
jgi:hypothetical protein